MESVNINNWQEVKLIDLSLKIQSGGTPKSDNSQFYNGDIPFVKIDDITKSRKYLLDTKIKISFEGLTNSSAWLVPENSVLYSMYASIGFVSINKIKVSTNQAILNIIPNLKKVELEYLYYYLDSIRNNLSKYVDHNTQKNLNAAKVKNFLINLPTSLNEQEKIANILISVDNSIEQTQNTIEYNQKLKKALLQKMLKEGIGTKEKKKVKLGLKEIEIPIDWEIREFGEFLKESRIKGNKGNTSKKITVKLYGKGVFPKSNSLIGSSNTNYYFRSSGQFIYSKLDFLNGAFGLIPEKLDNYETTLDMPCFDISNQLNSKYLLRYVLRESFHKSFEAGAIGGRKARRVQVREFLNSKFIYPPIQEQEKIAKILQIADKKIELEQKKKQILEQLKKGLMQQLLTGKMRVKY